MNETDPDAELAEPSPQAQADAEETVIELDQLLMSPGTYFNPQTEVLVVVDDSTSIDQEIFNMEAYEGAEWVRVSDDVPVDEERRDELLERFQFAITPVSRDRSPRLPSSRGTRSSTRARMGRIRAGKTRSRPGSRQPRPRRR